jgi:hypothetical protein
MKRDEIEVGGTYQAKVGTRMVEVRVERENGRGGWDAISVGTGKPVRLKDPKHLRPVKAARAADAAPAAPPEGGGPAAEPVAPTRAPKARKGGKAVKREAERKPMSCLDAAAAVLKTKGEPMNCNAMIEAMAEQGLWKSDAPTPAATLSSAILREMTKQGDASRFRKTSPGHFTINETKGD